MRNTVLVVYITTVIAATVWMSEFHNAFNYDLIQDILFDVPKVKTVPTASLENMTKCDLSKDCPLSHFAVRIKGGAADAVGPTICFDGHVVMSHVLRNVQAGLNVVQVNGHNGTIERIDSLHMYDDMDTLASMTEIKPGTIVLVASFDDVSEMMTEEAKDVFVGLGSALVNQIKYRDSWVFAGHSGMSMASPLEELTTNDQQTNVYGGWPELSEVAGCLPRTL